MYGEISILFCTRLHNYKYRKRDAVWIKMTRSSEFYSFKCIVLLSYYLDCQIDDKTLTLINYSYDDLFLKR